MAQYPNEIYTPREKENRAGVVYNPNKKSVIFAEDIKALDEEVKAIETELGTNPKGAFASVKEFLQYLLSKVKDHLSDLLDVEISNPQDGHVLTYEAATQKWKNKEPTGGAKTFLDLTDTPSAYSGKGKYLLRVKQTEDGVEFEKVPLEMIENPNGVQGDLLFWDGSKWVRLAPGQAGQFLKTQGAGANPVWATLDVPTKIVPSDAISAAADTERSTNSSTPVKVKEIKILRPGNYRVKFDFKASNSGYSAYAQIYKNGNPLSDIYTTTNSAYTTIIYDISGLVAGDLIQLYIWKGSALYSICANFRLCGAYVPINQVTLD